MHHIDTVFRSYNLPEDYSKESFAIGVRRWSDIITNAISELPPDTVISRIRDILETAWKETHIRCQLIELLAKGATVRSEEENVVWCERLRKIVMNIDLAFQRQRKRLEGVRVIREIEQIYRGAEELLTFIWTEQPDSPDPGDRFGWRDHPTSKGVPTMIYWPHEHSHLDTSTESDGAVDLALIFQEKKRESFRSELLSGQQAAFDALLLMLKAKREGLSAGGIKPRLHGLIIGPSGSGKTHVVRAVAEAERLPLFEQSAASWQPQGSRTEISTPRKIAEFVNANNGGIIYLDEIEKPFPPDSSKTIPWERYCTDEFMSLLDAKVAQWDHWSIRLAAKLDKSFFIVLSGAWQSAYAAAFKLHHILGGDWTNLSIADTFLDENHLPPELLNRVSTNVIEVLPPSKEELAQMIMRVQEDLGLGVDEKEAILAAKEIAQERKGVRAVEEYMLKRWMRQQEKAVLESEARTSDLS